jgi:septal ring factor EnvC (AmiA/AmiB activator)
MLSIIYLFFFVNIVLSQLPSTHSQINTPTHKGAEIIPDDYADALNKLEKDIGSGNPTLHTPKKLHKRADLDELKKFKSQIDARQKKRKSKAHKGDLSPEEILMKTDEELLQIYYEKQKDMHAQMNEMYQKVSEKLKGTLSDDEREKHTKRKEMIEQRKQRMADDQEKQAKRVCASFGSKLLVLDHVTCYLYVSTILLSLRYQVC